jgi:putative ABC transport system ATP-binding protein
MSEVVLSLRDVRKRYGSLEVVRGVDLDVRRGELAAIVGPSGSGKSTLLHVMGTLDRPTSGEVVVDGVNTAGLSDAELAGLRAHRVGFVFQSFHLMGGTTAVDNVAAGLLYSGVRRAERRRRARAVLRRLGLGQRLDHTPEQMSGGERQRVAIARALLARPAVVLADEPTGNLDTHSGADVLALLQELHDEGTTVVVITHDRDLAGALPRQIHVRDGLVVSDDGLRVRESVGVG